MIPYWRRPSVKELYGQLRKAKLLLAASQWAPVNEIKLAGDFHGIGLHTAAERAEALMTALLEIDPEDYVGRRPPERSYEKRVYGRDFFAFSWPSRRFRRRMYLKFCVTKDALFILSFHESRKGG